MMHRIIIVLGWLVAATNTLGAQVALDTELLHLEKQIFSSSSDSAGAALRVEKFELLVSNGRFEEALILAEDVEFALISDSARGNNFLWNASLLNCMNGQMNRADYYQRKYASRREDNSIEHLEIEALIYAQLDTSKFAQHLQRLIEMDPLFSNLKCYASLTTKKEGHSTPYVMASAILPGSGMIASGFPMKGITAMGLTAGSVWVISTLIQNAMYLNAACYFLMAGIRFYMGNLTLTENLYYRRREKRIAQEAEECKSHFTDLMLKYPIRFR